MARESGTHAMFYANLLGKASKIASSFYKKISEAEKVKELYKRLTGVMRLLKEERDEKEIMTQLQQIMFPETVAKHKISVLLRNNNPFSFADEMPLHFYAFNNCCNCKLKFTCNHFLLFFWLLSNKYFLYFFACAKKVTKKTSTNDSDSYRIGLRLIFILSRLNARLLWMMLFIKKEPAF